MKIKDFKELTVWQRSIELIKEIYTITAKLPKNEAFGLISQTRRSSISIPSNIAEGFKRYNIKEYVQFLRIADSSSAELETQLIVIKEIFPKVSIIRAEGLLLEVQRMLISLIKKLNQKK